jgi:membrane-associated protease RseP (regulator of RpoE activity)
MNVVLAVLILGVVFMAFGVSQPGLTIAKVNRCVIATNVVSQHCQPDSKPAPAMLAGFRPGDHVESVDGVHISSWDQFSEIIRNSVNKRIHVVVQRDGRDVTLTASPTVNVVASLDDPTKTVRAGFLGVSPVIEQQREGLGYTLSTMGSYTKQTGEALLGFPGRIVNVAKAAVGQPRDPNSPMSVVGAGRVAGEVASNDQISVTDRLATLLQLLGIVNLFVALFNFVPLLPLDGGHIAGALYEAVRRAWARLRRRPDPGYADVAQMLPIAYAAASLLIVMGVLLIWADIVNPIKLTG